VSDEVLSRAVVIYVWGLSGRPCPSRDTEAVSQAFGEQALDLLPRIEAIFNRVDAVPASWSGGLNAATDRIEAMIREAYPDLDDEAVRAIGNQFSYANRQPLNTCMRGAA
jgi:hypothetical protein